MTSIADFMSKRKMIMIAFILVLVVTGYVYFGGSYTRDRGKQFYSTFNSSDLRGEIEKIYIAYKGVALKLNDDSTTYIFYPVTSQLNDNNIFDNVAEKGDKIIKPAYSDTLKLVKRDKIYLYTFQKIEI